MTSWRWRIVQYNECVINITNIWPNVWRIGKITWVQRIIWIINWNKWSNAYYKHSFYTVINNPPDIFAIIQSHILVLLLWRFLYLKIIYLQSFSTISLINSSKLVLLRHPNIFFALLQSPNSLSTSAGLKYFSLININSLPVFLS